MAYSMMRYLHSTSILHNIAAAYLPTFLNLKFLANAQFIINLIIITEC